MSSLSAASPGRLLRARPVLVAVVAVALGAVIAAFALAGGSGAAHRTALRHSSAAGSGQPQTQAHPQVVQPEAGVAPGGEIVQSAGASHAPSDAQVRQELSVTLGASHGDKAGLDRGLAQAPANAPAQVAALISAGNQIAKLPYRYGGGHGGFVDTAYDCSGSLSFALAAAGVLREPLDSTGLSHWGKPGPGHWITIYSNAGHAFMVVAGLRFDTVGLAQAGSRWQADQREVGGFVATHPPGL